MTQLLTALEATPYSGHRFLIELASDEVELDAWGIPVPKDFKAIDVVVAVPSKEAIEAVIADTPWLRSYKGSGLLATGRR